jgi:Predicted P-loop-containing kinase
MSLESLFEQYTGSAPVSSVALTGSASHRRYYRLTGADGRTLIGVEGTDPDENRAFLTIDRHFAAKGIKVPQVVAVDGLCYLQEDLGSTVLYDALAAGRSSGNYSPDEVALLRKTLAALPKIQVEGARGLDFSVCYPQPSFDARMVDFDLNYFKYDFLKLVGVEFNEVFLQDDFDLLKADLLAEPSDTFLYRDFNARNVMLVDGEPWFIDFQGGRRGPVYYDVASFLWQARAKYPEALREELLQVYLDALRAYGPVDEVHFRQRLRLFILFRMLQVLGCYGYRGLWEGNKAFSSSIPPALAIVKSLLPFNDYPYLSEVLSGLSAPHPSEGVLFPEPSAIGDCSVPPPASGGPLEGLASGAPENLPIFGVVRPRVATGSGNNTPSDSSSALTVTIYSFSFKKGIPEDPSGNGGGYVFDCRSVHNPGKYERFKQLTGLDEPVIRFLEEDGEILRFLDHVYALVDAHVERFLERGFTHLQVSFGCTGGQHRSAYSAQHLAEHLVAKYPVRVHLIHRERGIERWLPEECVECK